MSFELIPNLILIITVVGILVLFLRRLPEVIDEKGQAKMSVHELINLQARPSDLLQKVVRAVKDTALAAIQKIWNFMLEAKDLRQGQILASKFARMVTPGQKHINIGVRNSLKKAERLVAEKNFEEAEQTYFTIVKKYPHEYAAYEGLVKIYIRQHNYDNLIEVLRYLIQHVPDNDSYLAQMGNVLMSTRHYDEAIQMYGRSLVVNDLVPARFVNIGLCYQALGQYQKALENFQRAVDLEPSNISYLMVMVDLLEKLDDKDRALIVLGKAAEMHPSDAQIKKKLLLFKK